jgi:hypothetical protein
VGWWTGYKIGGLISLLSADILQKQGVENYWQISFIILSLIITLCSVGLLFIPEKNSKKRIYSQDEADQKILNKIGFSNFFTRSFTWLYGAIINPLLSFFKKNTINVALSILGFIFLFKIGEAFLGRMSLVFYKEIGFSKTDIALYSKGIGWITTVTFTLLGGLFAVRMGLIKAMFVSGILMASTNILFSILVIIIFGIPLKYRKVKFDLNSLELNNLNVKIVSIIFLPLLILEVISEITYFGTLPFLSSYFISGDFDYNMAGEIFRFKHNIFVKANSIFLSGFFFFIYHFVKKKKIFLICYLLPIVISLLYISRSTLISIATISFMIYLIR